MNCTTEGWACPHWPQPTRPSSVRTSTRHFDSLFGTSRNGGGVTGTFLMKYPFTALIFIGFPLPAVGYRVRIAYSGSRISDMLREDA